MTMTKPEASITPALAAAGGKPVRTAPWTKWPVHGQEEEKRLLAVLESGEWWYGERVREFERKYADFHGAKHGITCCNGTVALEISLRVLGVGPGDEVIVPAYTFIATANAVAGLNAIPRMCDVEPGTANIDFDAAERLVNEHTKAICVVHFAGLPADLDRARAFASKHNIKLLEDAAHSWGSQWNGKGVGAIGDMGTFSFQVSKNITAGEAGIVVTDNDDYAAAARSYTHVGRMEGKPWYQHFIIGGNLRITEFQAAILLAQFDRLEEQTLRREANAAFLDRELSKIPGLRLAPRAAQVTRRSYHMYLLGYLSEHFNRLPRANFLKALEAEGIPCSQGYLHPVYKNPCYMDLNDKPRPEHKYLSELCNQRGVRFSEVQCPVSEKLCGEEMIWLPHTLLLGSTQDMEQIVEAILKIAANPDEAR